MEEADVLTKVDEQIYQLSLAHWFEHQLYRVDADQRSLNYFVPYAGIDAFNYIIEFDQEIQLANKENIDQKVVNDCGSYNISANQINPKMISIRAKYIIKSNHIKADSVSDLSDLNRAATRADDEGLYFQIVSNK